MDIIEKCNLFFQENIEKIKKSDNYQEYKEIQEKLRLEFSEAYLSLDELSEDLLKEFLNELPAKQKIMKEIRDNKIMKEFTQIVKECRFSINKQQKLKNKLYKYQKREDLYIANIGTQYDFATGNDSRSNYDEINEFILDNSDFFINLSKKNGWLKTTILDKYNLLEKINNENYKQIIDIYIKCDKDFRIDDKVANALCLIDGIFQYENLTPDEIKKIENQYNQVMIKNGFFFPSKLKTFYEKLDDIKKEEFVLNLKNKIKEPIQSGENLFMYFESINDIFKSISMLESNYQNDILNTIYTELTRLNNQTNFGTMFTLLLNISNISPEFIKAHKDLFLSYLEPKNTSNDLYGNYITILKNLNIANVNDNLKNNKHEYVKYAVSDALKVDIKDIENYSTELFAVEEIINELLSFQKMEFNGLTCIGEGLSFKVYQVGDYVLKLGKDNSTYVNHPDILQPLIRGKYGKICIEVQPKIKTTNLDMKKVDEIIENLKKDGYNYYDLGDNQFGYIDKPINLFKMKNGQNLPHLNQNLNFIGNEVGQGELTEDFYKTGKYYIVDTGCILGKNEPQNEEDEVKRR